MPEVDYISVIDSLPGHIEDASRIGRDVVVAGEFDRIVVAGVGGSAIPGLILQSYPHVKLPVIVCRDYSVPEFVNKRALLFVISYSGDTEEALSFFRECLGRGCAVVCVTSGGKLSELCLKAGRQVVRVPRGLSSRSALPYLFFPVLNVLYNSGLIPNPRPEIDSAVDALRTKNFKEQAEDLANKIGDRVPVIYSSCRLSAVAYRWKAQINETAKVHAFCHFFPELNHNELNGYSRLNAGYYVVFLQDESDHQRNKDRMRITKNLISEKGVSSMQLVVRGENMLTRVFSAIHIGDLVSYFLALRYGVDPSANELVDSLKRELGEKRF